MIRMYISRSSVCHLCAASCDNALLTDVCSEKGKQHNLELLINQYVTPIFRLPKTVKLCVCDNCKTRLQSWDTFITSCRKVQNKLKELIIEDQKIDFAKSNKRLIDEIQTNSGQPQSSLKKKRSCTYCAARWCNKGNYQGVSLFRFPRERDRAMIWLEAADRKDLKSKATLHSYYLCADHFTVDMFTNKACNQLIKKAVPTVFPRPIYADKIALKAEASQIIPKQYQGVPLKSILPKTSLPHRSSSPKSVKLVLNESHNIICKRQDISNAFNTDAVVESNLTKSHQSNEQNSYFVLSSEPSVSGNSSKMVVPLMKLVPLATKDRRNSNPPPLFQNSHELLVSNQNSVSLLASCSNSDVDERGDKRALNGFVESSAIISTNNASLVTCGQSYAEGNICHLNDSESKVFSSAISPVIDSRTDSKKSSKKEQAEGKELLDDLESCFSSHAFNANDLLSSTDGIQTSRLSYREPKRSCSSSKEQQYPNVTLDNITAKPKFMKQSTNYQLSTGSQDLLLPHMLDKTDKPSNFNVQPSLGSGVSTEVSDVGDHPASLSVLQETNRTLHHTNEINTTHMSLFDLQSDDIQGPINSSYINNMENLDELMDLDHFFEAR